MITLGVYEFKIAPAVVPMVESKELITDRTPETVDSVAVVKVPVLALVL